MTPDGRPTVRSLSVFCKDASVQSGKSPPRQAVRSCSSPQSRSMGRGARRPVRLTLQEGAIRLQAVDAAEAADVTNATIG